MTFSTKDYDAVWCSKKYPAKIWATSKISYNGYINDVKGGQFFLEKLFYSFVGNKIIAHYLHK
jgi:hypothetical protein